jgi:hypothetical protein
LISCAILSLLTLCVNVASGQSTQNVSIPVSGGTLNYQYQVQTGSCGGPPQTSANLWQNFSFTPSGGTATPMSGNLTYVYPDSYCRIMGGWDYEYGDTSSNGFSNNVTLSPTLVINDQACSLTFSASEGYSTGSASMTCENPDILYPLYKVQSIIYDTPGGLPELLNHLAC